MTTQLQMKGFLYPGGSCTDSCNGTKGAVTPFELAFRNCAESYAQVRSGDFPIRTNPGEYGALPMSEQFTSIELLALRTSAQLIVRLNGTGALAVTAALFPVADLAALTLEFGVDGVPIAVTFGAGDDSATDVARRINGAAALAGLTAMPARVAANQVEIQGLRTGPEGALTPFTGTAAEPLGLDAFVGAFGTGSDLTIDGVQVWQFPRTQGVRRIEVSGQANLVMLAAGT